MKAPASPPRIDPPPASEADRQAASRALFEKARQAWPDVVVSDEALLAHFASAVPSDGAERPDLLETLRATRLDDVYLALGCASGQTKALEHFRRLVSHELRQAERRARGGQATADELFQRLCQRLFLAEANEAPRVSRYAGRGPLRAWARVVLARMLADQARDRLDEAEPFDDGRLAEVVWMGDDPELAFIKAQTREQLREAVREALGHLSPRERNLLRQHYVHGLGIDALGLLIGAHRATAARQLANAREALCSGIRRQLAQRLGLGYAELQSLLLLISSRLDVSLPRLLAESSTTEP